ncbi:MAG TPA: hypothetical protein DCS04_04240 [Ruminococcaceae bacterium]|nr:hypothetical protein [Oscillospiraceae bacterium]
MFRKILAFIISLTLGVLTFMPPLRIGAVDGNEIFVAPDGNDLADGTISSPLATISAAKEKAKSLSGSVTVYFRGGSYTIDSTVQFDGSDKSDVVYKAYKNEKVTFTSGTPYTGFEECTVNGVRAFKKNIGKGADFNILFNEKTTLSRTRYPESGYLYVSEASDSDIQAGDDITDPYHAGFNGMYVDREKFADFRNLTDITIKLLHFWKDETVNISSYDNETGHISFSKTTSMRVKKNDRFFLQNVFEMLRKPGQWYLDKSEGTLYVIPETSDSPESYTVWGSTTETMISVDGADGISFENILFRANGFYYSTEREHSQAAYNAKSCITYRNAKNFHIKNCEFRDIAACSILLGKAVRNASIDSCLFNNIGAQAVYVHGENIDINDPDVTKNITITNNQISEYGRTYFNAVAILIIHANSVDIIHNEIHDGYYTAVSVGWVWGYDYNVCYNNKVCDNLIYNIGQGWLSDMGGIYMLGNQPGTVISGNVIHNVSADPEEGGYGGWGIYLDEGSSYMLVEKNLAYACGSDSYHLHYGSYNTVRNNIFALSGESQMKIVSAPDRCTPPDGGQKTADLYNNIILTDKKVRTLSCLRNTATLDEKNNTYWDLSAGKELYASESDNAKRSMSLNTAIRKNYVHSPIIADPMFRDAANYDFELSPDSPAIAAGFETWDYSNAGTLAGSTIGLSTEGGTTAYNASSAPVPMTPAKEPGRFFINIYNAIYFFFKNLFTAVC